MNAPEGFAPYESQGPFLEHIGPVLWRENGDGFAVYFGFISRVALFGSRRDDEGRTELILRRPLSEL